MLRHFSFALALALAALLGMAGCGIKGPLVPPPTPVTGAPAPPPVPLTTIPLNQPAAPTARPAERAQ